LSRKRWTLLVQGVDLHLDSAHRLIERFRFIPDARLDDLMISLASDQGGVGPHVDAYDVFLLQIWGKRRWRVARPGHNSLKPGLPLKILEHFDPDEEWLLEPGDMLYLPPGWGHDGIAEGPCMTASIGFRAPSRHEFLREFLSAAADDPGGADPRFGDPGRSPARGHPAQIPTDLHRSLSDWARDWRPEPEQIERFIGRFLTEPKPSVWFESRPMPATTTLSNRARRTGLRLDRRSRMMYRGKTLFVNGEDFRFEPAAFEWFCTLADQRGLSASQCVSALETPGFVETVRAWIAHGWIGLGA
jgi:50S ribosomal protein L16 3-hydroxylase